MLQAFIYDDVDHDKVPEILCAGNFYPYNVEQGKSDAFFGAFLNFSNGWQVKKNQDHYG